MSSKTIIRLDASALKGDSACEFKYAATVLQGLREPLTYNDTLYGTAFHKFAAIMAETGGNVGDALSQALVILKKPCKIRSKKEHLNEKHFIPTCTSYWNEIEANRSNYDSLIDPTTNCPLVEFTFEIPVYEDDDYQILVDGTIDRIGKIKNGAYCIRDFKTTSSWKQQEFLESFRCSPQFKLYIWALKRQARDNPDSILAEITKYPLVAFIDGIFLKSAKETEFASSDAIQYKQWELDEFESLLFRKITEIIRLHREYTNQGKMPPKTGKIEGLCYTGFNCKYYNICHALDDVVAGHVMKNNFIVRAYDPLNFID